MEQKENKLLTGKIAPALTAFALPFLFSYFLQTLYGAVDLLVVGQFSDAANVSAVANGSQILMIVLSVFNGIAMGGTVLIGHKIGEGNRPGVSKAVGNTITLFIILAIIITPLMLLTIGGWIRIMQMPLLAVPHCRTYLFISCSGIPFIVGYNAISAIYRGIGDSKTPVYFIIIATLVNVGLDFLLTGYFHMAAAGAAIATIAAQGISFISALIYMRIKHFPYQIKGTDLKPEGHVIGTILKVGAPLALQDVLVHFSFMAISAITNTLGVIASAAVGVVEKLLSFAFLIPSSFASAVATMASQNIGAKQQKRAFHSMLWGMLISGCFGVAIFALSNIIPNQLVSIFSNDSAVIAIGAQYIRTYSFDAILTAFIFTVNAYLNANERSIFCFIHSMAATFIIRLPGTYFLKELSGGNLFHVGLAAPLASMLSIIICSIYLYANRKKLLSE